MNKYIKYLSYVFVSGTMLTSCDVMDTEPLEAYTPDMVWNSKQSIDAFVFNIYADVFNVDNSSWNHNHNSKMWGDITWTERNTPNACAWMGTDTSVPRDRLTSEHDAGINKFGLLRKCNTLIENLQTASGISDEQRKELTAEGKFLRGMVYFAQARYMGRFVPINKRLNPDSKEEFATPLTKDVADSYKNYVLPDLEAGKDLPETAPAGRLTRYAAYAFLSEACLQAYAYTKDATYLTKAIDAADQVINSQKYTLADADRFANMFQNAGKEDKEIIFGLYRLGVNTRISWVWPVMNNFPNFSQNNYIVTPMEGNPNAGERVIVCGPQFDKAKGEPFVGWQMFCPTQDLADAFLVIDQEDGKAKRWYETSQFLNATQDDLQEANQYGAYTFNMSKLKRGANTVEGAGNIVIPNTSSYSNRTTPTLREIKEGHITKAWKLKPGYDEKNISELMYEHRDKRFYATLVYDSCRWMNQLVTMHCNGNLWENQDNSGHHSLSNYFFRKGVYHTADRVWHDLQTDWHAVLTRLGRVYMNKAEALLAQGNYQDAMPIINLIRTTHGELPEAQAANLDEAWEVYKSERRVELAYENDYYYSLLRWGMIGGPANKGRAPKAMLDELNSPVHGIQIDVKRERAYIHHIINGDNQYDRAFSEKRYLMPIPQGFLNTRAASGIVEENNPGW